MIGREIATDNFDALYAVLKPKGVTVSAMLAKAVAEVLKKHPVVNAAYVEGGIKYNKGARLECISRSRFVHGIALPNYAYYPSFEMTHLCC